MFQCVANDCFFLSIAPVPMQFIYRTRDKVWDFYEVRILTTRYFRQRLLKGYRIAKHKESSDFFIEIILNYRSNYFIVSSFLHHAVVPLTSH